MKKKYKLTNDIFVYHDIKLYRIKALKDFDDVSKGQLGGYIESEKNLSQEGNCWVYDNAMVYNNARVYNNAKIHDSVHVYNHAIIHGNAIVKDNAAVYGDAAVFGNACIAQHGCVHDQAEVYGHAYVYHQSEVRDESLVYDHAWIGGHSIVRDRSRINDYAVVAGSSKICDSAYICDNVHIINSVIGGNVVIGGYADIKNAEVFRDDDYIVFKNWWSSGRYFTWTRSNNMWNVGCFYGTGKELIEKAYQDSQNKGIEYERVVNYVNSIRTTTNEKVFKTIPSADIEIAKEITNKETSSKIVTKDGKEIQIICFNKNDNYYAAALIECSDENIDTYIKKWFACITKVL